MRSYLHKDRFMQGLKLTVYITLGLIVISVLLWLLIFRTFVGFPFDTLTLGIGGLLWAIAGCIGPGRYKPLLPLALYDPRDKGSFHKFVKISGFVTDPLIHSAKVIVDGTEVGELLFKNNVGELVLKDTDLPDGTVHYVWLEGNSGDKYYYSNKNLFTFYDPTDFSEAELLLIEKEEVKKDVPIAEAYKRYLNDKYKHHGSLSFGFFTGGVIIFLLGLLYTAIVF